MGDLTAAHRGYEYQDLMAACRLVDVVLGDIVSVRVDEKLFAGDRFDDLTTVDVDGCRERSQFKHTDDDRPLALATFTSDGRDLRLDRLVAAAAADRDGVGAEAASVRFRVVLRDGPPVDDRLLAVLRPANPDPGPFQPGMATRRMAFDADALWDSTPSDDGKKAPFAFLRHGDEPVTRADLDWLCSRLVIEVGAPPASWDLTSPGPAEALLIDRLRADVGAGAYPNQDRPAHDVAHAFVQIARAARQRTTVVAREEVLRRAQLRRDYGAVARSHPVDPAIAVARAAAVSAVADAAAAAAGEGGTVVLTAPPGHGKSWLCEQVVSSLDAAGWLVAEHYCYLGDADGDLLARVLAESLFGSLLARIADADPGAVAGQRPLFAASDEALCRAVAQALERAPERPVALVVDGLDHVTRVRRGVRGLDPSHAIAEALAALELPPGSALVVLSQPGAHLAPLLDRRATVVPVPGLSRPELAALAAAQGIDGGRGVVDALEERSSGNALYATYLCRELVRDAAAVDPAAAVRLLPPFDGSLENYYEHLWSALDDTSWWVAEVVALLDFAVTREELEEIRPDFAHRVAPALDALAPVLVDRPAQGGIRIYHESFGRYLRRDLQAHAGALAAVLQSVAAWLRGRGLFEDPRAFRSLIPILAEAERHDEAAALVGDDFVVRAVAAAMPVSAIQEALATAATSAARAGDWAAVVRCVELGRAAGTLQDERYESTLVTFADVVTALVGTDAVADRLLYNGRTVMAARAGLQMCAAIDAIGGVPPWREYLAAHLAEDGQDNTNYGAESDLAVDLAWLRGRLRLSAAAGGPPPGPGAGVTAGPGPLEGVFTAPVDWDRLAEDLDDGALPAHALVRMLADTYGDAAVDGFARLPQRAGPYCLAVAEAIASGTLTGSAVSARAWGWAAVAHGLPAGTVERLAATGVDPDDAAACRYDRSQLLSLARAVQDKSVRWEKGLLGSWQDQRYAAARLDPLALDAAEALLTGPGWYRCWLRFTIAVARAEPLTGPALDTALLHALALLTADLDPFAGDPRACDLWPIHGPIQDSVARAVSHIADPDDWERAIGVVRDVSDAVTTTLMGERGGPLPPDWVMHLTIRTAPSSKIETVRSLARAAVDDGDGGQFYSDVADTTLVAARVELAAGDTAQARSLWAAACRLLVAYGWRKDITIYELLDPFPELIEANPARARQRLPELQALCERVLMHTDGKETRHAPSRWWTLLAAADPAALAGLVAPAEHAQCNDPGDHRHEALVALWRAASPAADPFIAAALRLALEPALDPHDAACVERLARTASSPDGAPGRLLSAYLARLDERPASYSVSNSDELVATDDRAVAAVNDAARAAPGAPPVLPLPVLAAPPKRDVPMGRPAPLPPADTATRLASLTGPAFPDGPVGLARAVRAWQSRAYEDRDGWWEPDRAANVLGYRLLAMAQAGERAQAAALLHQIADGVGYARDSGLLAALAQGLSRHGEDALAATAGALAWTRAPGRGGWLSFGGVTRLGDLKAAVDADADTALATVAHEVAHTLRQGRRGSWGITQALVLAFAAGAASPSLNADTAFDCFDAAMRVIADRAPRTHPRDDPELPYLPPSPDAGGRAPGNLDVALAAAAIAGIARPAREAKRRAMLATELLVAERPDAAAEGVRIALAHLSDPCTLTWLLALLVETVQPGSPVLTASSEALDTLAAGPHLTVRALARSLALPPPSVSPPEPADPELASGARSGLWTPGGAAPEDEANSIELVDEYAGERLAAAEPLLPGLTAAVLRRVALAHNDTALRRRVSRQIDALADRHRNGERWPDAHLALAEAVEDALQRAASGARSADMLRGIAYDPVQREAELAERILDPPSLALALEAARRPRPDLPPPPSRYDPVWDTLANRRPDDGAAADRPLFGMLSSKPVIGFDRLADAGGGWRVLASAERLVSSTTYGDKQPDLRALRLRGVVLADDEVHAPDAAPPLAAGPLDQWTSLPPLASGPTLRCGPLAALAVDVGAGTDGRQGLGLPDLVVVPGDHLLVAVGATATSGPFEIGDKDGPLLALRMWRTLYETSEYHQPWPRLTGTALVVTERALERLASAAPDLVLRDFVDRR